MTQQLDQYFTPAWAAERIVQHFYPGLNQCDCVLEPSCGDGRFLMAVPKDVQAIGVEIDPVMAERARVNSGRQVVTGNFLSAKIDLAPTLILGNPPFESSLIEQFLQRSNSLLREGQQVGFIIPAYIFQTSRTVARFNKSWSIEQHMLPRDLFHGLTKPLIFAQFTKDRQRILSGFFLYQELEAVQEMHKEFKTLFVGNDCRANVWGAAVEKALIALGGEASLQEIYSAIEGNRPTPNPWWKEKIRQVAGQFFNRVEPGRFALEQAA